MSVTAPEPGGYKRQLSDVSAALMAVSMGGVFIISSLLLGAAMFVFSPLLTVVSTCMVGWALLAYPQRHDVQIDETAGMLFFSQALAVPFAVLIFLGLVVFQHFYPAPLLAWSPDDKVPTVWFRGILVAHAVVSAVVVYRLYVKLPANLSLTGELKGKSLQLAILIFGFYSFGIALFLTAPAAIRVLAFELARERPGAGMASYFLLVTAVPPLVVGIALLRMSWWMREFGNQIRLVPTSKLHAAAMGPVEVVGIAENCAGESSRVLISYSIDADDKETFSAVPFVVDDGTSRVNVIIPEEGKRLPLGVHLSNLRSDGYMRKAALEAGSPVYVFGELALNAKGEAMIRPWQPPFGRYLLKFVRALLSNPELGNFGLRVDQLMGIYVSEQILIVSDQPEGRVALSLFQKVRQAQAWGALFILSSVATIWLALR